jgi:hypothetical protein
VPDVRSEAIAYRRGGSIRPLSSVMIIPLCFAPVAVVTAGRRKTDGFINAIAGDQKASTARPRLGMDSRAPSAAASRI